MDPLYLNLESIKNKKIWEQQGFKLPEYDILKIRENTINNPRWLHFGAGNLFRAFPARIQDEVLDDGLSDTGVIVSTPIMPNDFKEDFKTYDNLSLAVGLKSNASLDLRVVGCISQTLAANTSDPDWIRLIEIFQNPNLSVVSFTITEKGYSLIDAQGNLSTKISAEMSNPTLNSEHQMGMTCLLLYERYKAGKFPLTLLSMDNLSQNGKVLEESIKSYAKAWVKNGFIEEDFLNYLEDDSIISFPWSMIDKITPRPDQSVTDILKSKGFIGSPDLNNKAQAFSNSEETEYLVIEDNFTNGRPNWDKKGIIYTSRDTVEQVEAMKVSTCLNPLHTALAVYGCLLSYDKINQEMKDPDLVNLIKGLSYLEGLKVVVDPGIIDPKSFLDTVINERFPNPFLPDTPQRIATDTSQKMSVRFGKNILRYLEKDKDSLDNLVFIPAVIAGWLRYLIGINDQGQEMTLSPDPMLEGLHSILNEIKFKEQDKIKITKVLNQVLKNNDIFGLDLTQTVLAKKIIDNFIIMNQEEGKVKEFLTSLPRFE